MCPKDREDAWFAFMAETTDGEVRGWEGDPGELDAAEWNFTKIEDGEYDEYGNPIV